MKRCWWPVVASLIVVARASVTLAIQGVGSVNLTPDNGWRAFEIVTQQDSILELGDPGYGNIAVRGKYDGLGTYVDGNKLSINVNHETLVDAAISRVDVSITALRQAIQSKFDSGATPFPSGIITGMGYAYDRIYDGRYHANNSPEPVAAGIPATVEYGNANFSRFCSGSSYVPEAFGPGRGLVDSMYITGEEVSGGRFYAIDQVTRTMWEVPDFGLGSWENAAQVDTGDTTHVAMVLNSDVGGTPGAYLRLYVGRKGIDANGDGTIDFLERNGLRGGAVFHFTPNWPQSTTDLPDAPLEMTGKWTITPAAALREDKLEDVHTNPLNGTQLVFSDQTDGVYRLDTPLRFFGEIFDAAGSTVKITQIDDDDFAPLGNPDNLVWSRNGKIYVQEDGDGYEIWQIDENGGGHVRIAQALSEPSGIIDASAELGYQPGSILFSSLQGSGPDGAQLVVLVSPAAINVFQPGDYNDNGAVDAADYVVWRNGLDKSYTPSDYSVWRAQFGVRASSIWGMTSVHATPAVPEPSGAGVLLVAVISGLIPRSRSDWVDALN